MKRLVIGTRGSALALWQARHVRESLLASGSQLQIDIQVIHTKGDKILDTALSKIGDKGLFTKEIENALLDKTVDLAVHSLKDLPTEIHPDLIIAAVPTREDPADVLISKGNLSLDTFPADAKVLTSSLRRQAQLKHRRSDLLIESVRGNVQTRLRKFAESDAQAIVFARAGLVRLELSDRITERLDPLEFLPACGQGALAVEIRKGDSNLTKLVESIEDSEARGCTAAERTFLAGMGGGCQVPIGAYARIAGEPAKMTIVAMVADLDGQSLLRRSLSEPFTGTSGAEQLGRQLAEQILTAGGREILDRVYEQSPVLPEQNS